MENPSEVIQLLEYLRKLAEPAVTAFVNAMYKQVYFYGFRDLFFVILIVTLVIAVWRKNGWFFKARESNGGGFSQGNSITTQDLFMVVSIILTIVGVVVFCLNMINVLNVFISPDYMVYREVIGFVKGLR